MLRSRIVLQSPSVFLRLGLVLRSQIVVPWSLLVGDEEGSENEKRRREGSEKRENF